MKTLGLAKNNAWLFISLCWHIVYNLPAMFLQIVAFVNSWLCFWSIGMFFFKRPRKARILGTIPSTCDFALYFRVEVFRGREDIVEAIRDYICTDCPRVPMVLHGVSGSGKTSVIAKAASLIHQWLPGRKPVRVLRFLGKCVAVFCKMICLCKWITC